MIAVNHLEGHMAAAFLGEEPPDSPFVCLVVSGGHTALYRVSPDGTSTFLGSTRDDAAGEAFDKVAKLLNLGYPGGIVIERLASGGDPNALEFPRALMDKDSLEFSFSGLKTSVGNFVRHHGLPPPAGEAPYRLEDLAASFQEAVVDVLVTKTMRAAALHGVADVAVVGGVAANLRLRERMTEEAGKARLNLHLPLRKYCTDNAVMIATVAHTIWRRSGFCPDPTDLDARSRWF